MEHPSGGLGQFIGEKKRILNLLYHNDTRYVLEPTLEFRNKNKINNIRFNMLFWHQNSPKKFKFKFISKTPIIKKLYKSLGSKKKLVWILSKND